MNLKKPYSIDERVKKLQEHGVIIEDIGTAKRIMHTMLKNKTRIIACLLAILLCTQSLTVEAGTATKDYSSGGCVSWARDRVEELLGFRLPSTGNKPSGVYGASNWWYNLKYPHGQVPATHALAIWSGGRGSYPNYGHVAFVENVTTSAEIAENPSAANTITENASYLIELSEGGFSSGTNGVRHITCKDMDRTKSGYQFLGYVYVDKNNVPKGAYDFQEAHLETDSDGRMYLSEKGKMNDSFTGLFCDKSIGWRLVQDGYVASDYNDLYYDTKYGWWKVKDGTVDFDYTDLYYSPACGWWKVKGGTVDFGYSGLVQNDYGWWLYYNGTIAWNYTGWWDGFYCVNGHLA